ncbi:NAD-dependent epimerase [Variovorax paradoxus]|uniref:NAD-dependent epimerase n=1 Tax=Variovorax paradoxus TaxID=34073 RepID=UPI002860078E|nr:NAD-dependent epimerase [Variovorax paradoxus]MDR6454224.1 UDP-glucuronate 4-epimerase [Variovorax paradoxus]
MKILLTGCAGFIGMHVAKILLLRGDDVLGIDNLNDYYDPELKRARLGQLKGYSRFKFMNGDISDRAFVEEVFSAEKPDRVINLAAQAGVRYSIENPHAYIQSNIVGFINILEGCRNNAIQHLVYASSSSVYGGNIKMPFSVSDRVDNPVSLYAATKKSNELMAHTYSHLYKLPTTGLRYFTVYGPWGRPDMSPWLFTSAITEGRPIKIFNQGKMQRDFTYIDDIAEGTVRALDREIHQPYKVYNIGNQQPVELMEFIGIIERELGREAQKEFLPMQPGDVVATFADVGELKREVGYEPKTHLNVGLANWVKWYKDYTLSRVEQE